MRPDDLAPPGVDGRRLRWRLGRRRRLATLRDAEHLGWSDILLGTDAVSTQDRDAIRERAIRTWLEIHGIADPGADAVPAAAEASSLD